MSRGNGGNINISSDVKQDVCRVKIPACEAPQSAKKEGTQGDPKQNQPMQGRHPSQPWLKDELFPGGCFPLRTALVENKSFLYPFRGGRCTCSCDVKERKATRNAIILTHSF